MFDLGTAMAYLDLDTSGFTRGISSSLSQLNIFTDQSATAADKLTAVGGTLTSMGKGLTMAVTTPLLGIGAASVKTAATFESTMSKVGVISGATADEMRQLNDKAKEMGATTAFSASEAGEAFTYMAMAGWGAEDMMSGISGIMNLAAADGLDLATTSDIVTDSLTAFGLSAKDSAHFADVLAVASSASNTSVSMLGESFKYVASVAGAANYSIEDVSLALGLMANAGIKSSQAGTALRSAILNMNINAGESSTQTLETITKNLDAETKAYEKNLKSQEKAVEDSYDSQQKILEKSLKAELKAFNEAYDKKIELIDKEYTEKIKLVDEERYNKIKAIQDEIDSLNAKTDAENKAVTQRQEKEKLAALEQSVRDAQDSEERIAAQKELADYQEELRLKRIQEERESEIDKLKDQQDNIDEEYDKKINALEDEQKAKEKAAKEQYDYEKELLDESQQNKKEALADQKEAAINNIREINEADLSAFKEVQEAKKAAAKESSLSGDIPEFREQLEDLRESFKDLSEQEKMVKAEELFGKEAVSGMLAIINATDEDFNKLANSIDNANGTAERMSKDMLNNLNGSLTICKSGIEGLAISVGEVLLPHVKNIVDGFTSFLDRLNSLDEKTKRTTVVIGLIASAIGPVLLAIGGLITGVGKVISLMGTLKNIISMGSGLIAGVATPVWIAVGAITALVAILVTLYRTNDEFKNGVDSLISRISKLGEKVLNDLKPAFEKLKQSLTNLWDSLQPIFEVIGEIFLFIMDNVVSLLEFLEPAFAPFVDFISELIDTISNIFKVVTAIITGDKPAFDEAINSVAESLKSTFNSAIEFVDSLIDGMLNYVGNIYDKIFGEGAFSEAKASIQEALDSVKNTIKDKFSEIIDKIKENFGPYIDEVAQKFNDLKTWWEENGPGIKDNICGIIEGIKNVLQPTLDFIEKNLGPTIDNLVLSAENLFLGIGVIIDALNLNFDGCNEKLEKIGENMFDIGQNNKTMAENFCTWWVDTFEALGGEFYNFNQWWNNTWEEFGSNLYDKMSASLAERLLNFALGIDDFKEGMDEAFQAISEFFTSIPDKLRELDKTVKNFFDGIGFFLTNPFGTENPYFDGSHYSGLDYVPYDGYIAQLHEGERVLTRSENQNYGQSEVQPVFVQNIYHSQTDRYTIQKDTEDLLRWGGVRV